MAPKGLNEDIIRLISEKKGNLLFCLNSGSNHTTSG